jgi:hypothetical protein
MLWPWLSAAAAWLVKLIGGWLPIGTKPVSEWLGKLIFTVGTSAAVFFLLTNFSGCKKKPPQIEPPHQTAGGSIVYVQPRLGCATINIPKDKQ